MRIRKRPCRPRMAELEQRDTVLVLDRTPRGENRILLKTVGMTHGYRMLMKRVSATRLTQSVTPDLFDTADVRYEGQKGFLSDYQLIRRRSGIARQYDAFQAASRFAAFLCRNLNEMPLDADDFHTFVRGFDALEAGWLPDAVLVKTLYLMARKEGYAVDGQWLAGLTQDLAQTAQRLLRQSLAELRTDTAKAHLVCQSLWRWLASDTDYIIDAQWLI